MAAFLKMTDTVGCIPSHRAQSLECTLIAHYVLGIVLAAGMDQGMARINPALKN